MKIQLHNYKDVSGGCRISISHESTAEILQIEHIFSQAEKLGMPVYRYSTNYDEEGIGFILAAKE